MKNLVNERLLLLANAQECMRELSDKMEQWNDSQLNTEKNAFESMNVSDHVLNMSREGKRLIARLQKYCGNLSVEMSEEKCCNINVILDEIRNMFVKITEASLIANDISHKLEAEVAFQKEIGESIKDNLEIIDEGINEAVACAELIMAEF